MLKGLKRKLRMTDREMGKLIRDIDQNGDGKIDVEEFLIMIEHGPKRDIICKALIQRISC